MIDRSQPALGITTVQTHLDKSLLIVEVVCHQYLVVIADAELAEHIFRDVRSGGLYEIVELHVFRILNGFPVDIDLCVFDFQRISR